jgi:hypothetical protein
MNYPHKELLNGIICILHYLHPQIKNTQMGKFSNGNILKWEYSQIGISSRGNL